MPVIDKIAYLHLVDGKILLTRSKGKQVYYIPGGKREGNETDEATLQREILEELNVNILPKSIQYVDTFIAQSDGMAAGIMVQMTCYKAAYEGTLQASSEIEEIRWMNYSDIDLVAEVDKIIFNYLRERKELK